MLRSLKVRSRAPSIVVVRKNGAFGAFGAAATVIFVSVSVPAATLAPTTTTITSVNPDPSHVAEPFTVSFAVSTEMDGGVPGGSVVVRGTDGSFCIGELTAGSGSCVLASHSVGESGIVAYYEGDSVFDPSASNSVSHFTSNPGLQIAGDPVAQLGSPYVVTLSGLDPSGAVDISFGDGNDHHIDYQDGGAPPSVSHVYLSNPGCYVVFARNGGTTSNPLGVLVNADDAGATTTCQPGVGADLVAQASDTTPTMGVSATLVRTTPGPFLALATSVFAGNPTPVPVTGAMFADVAVRGSTSGVTATMVLDYPATFAEQMLALFFKNNAWTIVQARITSNASESRLSIELDDQSEPSIAELNGTYFAVVKADVDAGTDGGSEPSDAASDFHDASGPPVADAAADAEMDAGTEAAADGTIDDAGEEPRIEGGPADANKNGDSDGGGDATTLDVSSGADGGSADSSVLDAFTADRSMADASVADASMDAPRDAVSERSTQAPDTGSGAPEGSVEGGNGCGCRISGSQRRSAASLTGVAAMLAIALSRRRKPRTEV